MIAEQGKLRYLLRKSEGENPRRQILQERVRLETLGEDSGGIDQVWVDVPVVLEEDLD